MEASLDLYRYGDYRSFLRDFHQAKRRANPRWSYGTWARRLNLKSSSTLVMILNAQRNPGPNLVAALCRTFEFNLEQSAYFQDLVALEKCRTDPRLSMLLIERLEKKSRGQTFRFLEPRTFAAISRWYYYALREMVTLPAFREDPHWIASRLAFRVSPKEIREALRTLLRLRLLVRDAQGKLVAGEGHLDVASDIADAGIQQFHQEALLNAVEAVKTVSPQSREVRGTTFAMPAGKVPQARELIRKFQNELCDLLEAPGSDSVYHLEVALYPVARVRGGGECLSS